MAPRCPRTRTGTASLYVALSLVMKLAAEYIMQRWHTVTPMTRYNR